MNLKLAELENLFEKIQNIIDYMLNSNYEDRRFKLYLSNGQVINFSINNSTLAHLLGININYLISTRLFNSTNSFDLLQMLVENPNRIHKLHNERIIDYNLLFSKHIINKVSHFTENIKLGIKDIEFVCKYEKERTYGVNEFCKDYDYIIVQKLSDEKIGVLCLVKNNGDYAPMSNQIYDNYDSFIEKYKDIIKFQEITLVSTIAVSNVYTDYFKNIYLNLQEKGYKVNNLKLYKKDLNCSIDVSNDLCYAINKMKENVADKNESNSLIDTIIEAIANNKFIDINLFENSYLFGIVFAWNEFLSSNGNNFNPSNLSEKMSKLKALKEQVNSLTNENEELKNNNQSLIEENDKLSSENNKLTDENKELIEAQNKIFQIIKKFR